MREIRKQLAPLQRQIRSAAVRGVVTLVDDALKLQGLQVTVRPDDVRDSVEHFQPYGLAYRPHAGAETVVISLGGSRRHGVALAVSDRRWRKKNLQPGEVCLYDDLGSQIYLKRGGEIRIVCAAKVVIEAPLSEVTGDLEVGGSITCAEDVSAGGNIEAAGEVADGTGPMNGMRTTYNGHTHPGVTTGPGSTGTTPAVMS